MPRSPLIIVGMHRSGTSFVASLLHAAGLDMGSRLMPAARGNERGHFENLDFVEFHMRWLRETGHDDAGWDASTELGLPEEAAVEARAIIAANANLSPWGWKDPRTTLFLDFWARLVPDANYAFVYREPSEVIDSLYRRGDDTFQLDPEFAARAYLTHNKMMLQHAKKYRARGIIANVSGIAANPRHFLEMVAEKFALDVDSSVPSTFEPNLFGTSAANLERATHMRELVPEIDESFEHLEAAADVASGGSPMPSGKAAFFREWATASKDAVDVHRRNAQLSRELADARAEISSLVASNTERGAYLEEAERLLALERSTHQSDIENAREVSRRLESQTEALIAEARAESDRLTLLIATVESSSFWKIKRGINRVLRSLHLARR